jgi:hypothetical protein
MTNSEKDASVTCEKWIARLTGEVYIRIEGFLRTQKGKELRHETTEDRLEDQDREVAVSNTSNLNGWTA